MEIEDRKRFIIALFDDKLDCSTCFHWKTGITNQIWGECREAPYCEDERADESPMVLSYTYCAAEKEGEPPIEHRVAMDTARDEFFCRFWKEK